MEPSARALRRSLANRLAPYTDFLQILPGHGAGSACGKSLGAVPTTTLGYERRFNSPFKLAIQDEEAFVKDILQGQPDPPLYFATMKRVNRDGIAVTGKVPEPAHLSPEEWKDLASDFTIQILDTRDDRESFDAGHAARGITAPLRTPFLTNAAGSFLNPSDKILLVVDDALRQRIHERAAEGQIRAEAQALGMVTMREDGQRWVTGGLTSLDEVIRVTRD
jgi:hydroxyacylglutathione hydrolase